MRNQKFVELAKKGVIFENPYTTDSRKEIQRMAQRMAMDAAQMTSPNMGIPVEFGAYIDPEVWDILTAPRNATEVFTRRQKGNWLTPYTRWAFHEPKGLTGPYSDFSDTPNSYTNHVWPLRQQYVFQTNIYYGLREQELMAEAKIDYAAGLQRSAARIIEIDHNKFDLLGVEGMDIYGLLNDPNLPAAIASTAAWDTLEGQDVYKQVQALFAQLTEQSNSLIDNKSELILLVSPAVSVSLGNSNQYNQQAWEHIEKFLPNLRVVVIPELASLPTGEQAFLIAPEVEGQRTADLGYGVLYEASSVVQVKPTKWEQKVWASTYGTIYYQPFAVARMTGVAA